MPPNVNVAKLMVVIVLMLFRFPSVDHGPSGVHGTTYGYMASPDKVLAVKVDEMTWAMRSQSTLLSEMKRILANQVGLLCSCPPVN